MSLDVKRLQAELLKDGFQVTQGSAAETTESFYFTVQRDKAYAFVRISNHPKPGFKFMRSSPHFVYLSWYETVAKALSKVRKFVR